MRITAPRCTPVLYLSLLCISFLTLLLSRISNLNLPSLTLSLRPPGLLHRLVLIADVERGIAYNNTNNNNRAIKFVPSRSTEPWRAWRVDLVIWIGDFRESRGYREIFPVPGFVFAFLDSNEERMVRSEDGVKWDTFSHSRFSGVGRVEKNWAIGEEQLEWLNRTISRARVKGDKIVIISQAPIHPKATKDSINLVRDYERVLELVFEDGSGVVVAAIAGPEPDGAFHFATEENVMFLTLSAALPAADQTFTDFALCDLFADKLQIRGFGKVPSHTLFFQNDSFQAA